MIAKLLLLCCLFVQEPVRPPGRELNVDGQSKAKPVEANTIDRILSRIEDRQSEQTEKQVQTLASFQSLLSRLDVIEREIGQTERFDGIKSQIEQIKSQISAGFSGLGLGEVVDARLLPLQLTLAKVNEALAELKSRPSDRDGILAGIKEVLDSRLADMAILQRIMPEMAEAKQARIELGQRLNSMAARFEDRQNEISISMARRFDQVEERIGPLERLGNRMNEMLDNTFMLLLKLAGVALMALATFSVIVGIGKLVVKKFAPGLYKLLWGVVV